MSACSSRMSALMASSADAHAKAVFLVHGVNVARVSATGGEPGMALSVPIAIWSNLTKHALQCDFRSVNGGVNGVETT